MSSITMWHRLEPRVRSTDMAESLAARIHDPLWFLTRQWQLGEYRGEDGGSATAAHIRGTLLPLTRMRLGADAPARSYDPRTPLEAQVEREPYRVTAPTTRDAAEAGLMWVRLLDEAGLAAEHLAGYFDHFPLSTEDPVADGSDPASEAFRGVLGGRVLDGVALRAEFDRTLRPTDDGSSELPPLPNVSPNQVAIKELALQWLRATDAFATEPARDESAWVSSKFEYRFAMAAPSGDGEIVLEVEEYAGGQLNWYAFRLGGEGLGAAEDSDRIETIERTVTPSPVEIPGNPASRFWEFEDGRVDLARLEAGPEDLARLLHAEYGLLYGDDWLLVPLDLPVGTLFRTDALEVEDSFGITTQVPPATAADDPAARWGFFHQSQTPGATTESRRPAPIFLVAPTLAAGLDGTPVEEVVLLRDEMSNLVWAVERQTQSARGRGLDRAEIYQRRRAAVGEAEATPAPGAELQYQMHGRVPEHWIPFMPVRKPGSTEAIDLQRGSVRDPETGELHRPIGRILVPDEPLFIDEAEATRAGVRLTRAARYARSSEGGVHLWMARRKRTGRGEASSGVAFDQLKLARDDSE